MCQQLLGSQVCDIRIQWELNGWHLFLIMIERLLEMIKKWKEIDISNDKVLSRHVQIERFYLGEGTDAPYNVMRQFTSFQILPPKIKYSHSEFVLSFTNGEENSIFLYVKRNFSVKFSVKVFLSIRYGSFLHNMSFPHIDIKWIVKKHLGLIYYKRYWCPFSMYANDSGEKSRIQ